MSKTLRDYRAALAPGDLSVLTHATIAPNGEVFSVHKDETSAQVAADRIRGTVAPYTPNPSNYWNGTEHYDH